MSSCCCLRWWHDNSGDEFAFVLLSVGIIVCTVIVVVVVVVVGQLPFVNWDFFSEWALNSETKSDWNYRNICTICSHSHLSTHSLTHLSAHLPLANSLLVCVRGKQFFSFCCKLHFATDCRNCPILFSNCIIRSAIWATSLGYWLLPLREEYWPRCGSSCGHCNRSQYKHCVCAVFVLCLTTISV